MASITLIRLLLCLPFVVVGVLLHVVGGCFQILGGGMLVVGCVVSGNDAMKKLLGEVLS